MKFFIHFFVFLLLKFNSFAQNDSIIYTKEFTFKDGIYSNYESLKKNKPILTKENFEKYNQKINYLDNNFFESSIFNEYFRNYIFYPDKNGNIQKIAIDSLFGFVVKGFPFAIMRGKPKTGFKVLRIFRLGTISYCFETKASSRNKLFPSSKSQVENNPLLTKMPQTDSFGFGLTSEVSQFLFTVQNGKFYKYKLKIFKILISKIDPELSKEFSKLSNSKKKKLIFNYITKVNERNPFFVYN